ncbi:MAG: tRNA (cytidine(56)-2'-O)-methyltransferase [Candidatus Nanohaloarchaea archaeon]
MIHVLRLGHRAGRDDRISTHVGLTARQWGCSGITYSGERDRPMMKSIRDIVERWGGDFSVEYREDWRKILDEFEGAIVHLTMYGERVDEKEQELQDAFQEGDFLVVVGAEKVPQEVYREADYNISVGNQPHSEIAALAVLLDRLTAIKEDFEDAEIEVVPSGEEKLTKEPDQ